MNKCLNCNEPCDNNDKFCDPLCHYGFSFRAYRSLDNKEKEE